MNNEYSAYQATQLFANPKKALKTLDKALDKQSYEYLVKAEDKGSYGVYSGDSDKPLCVCDDVFKAFMGVLHFEYKVGRKDELPGWTLPDGYLQHNWEVIVRNTQFPEQPLYPSINKALDNGSTLYCTNTAQEGYNSVVLTNPFNENYADKILFKTDSFSAGLQEADSMASFCLQSFEQGQN